MTLYSDKDLMYCLNFHRCNKIGLSFDLITSVKYFVTQIYAWLGLLPVFGGMTSDGHVLMLCCVHVSVGTIDK